MSGQRRALVVAIDRYSHPMLRKLAAPTADAAALARVLGEPDLGGFEVEVLTDANSYEVTQAVEVLLGEAKSSDLVLLHFSCHGIKDESGELFLAVSNTLPNRLVSTAVEAAMVSRLIQRSRAQRVVLLLDCCYGGAFERGVVARAGGEVDVAAQFAQPGTGGGRGRVIITASSAMEYAFEGTTLTDTSGPTPSLFTGALVEGITSGEADRDQDGQVGLDELYDYIHAKVQARTPNQTPSKWEFGVQGDLYIARNPRRMIQPARLPDELLELIAHPAASVRLAAVGDLDQLAGGHHLRLAAAARLALHELGSDDSRRVSAAAISALERTTLRITPTQVEWGHVPAGSHPRVEVRIDGGPLAQASSIEVTHQDLQARIQGSMLIITATAAEPGRLDRQVRLRGPAGDATVDITGSVLKTPHIPAQPAATRSHRPDLAARHDQLTPDPPATYEPPPSSPITGGAASSSSPELAPERSPSTEPDGDIPTHEAAPPLSPPGASDAESHAPSWRRRLAGRDAEQQAGRLRRRWLVAAAGVAFLAIAGGIAVVLGRGAGDDGTRQSLDPALRAYEDLPKAEVPIDDHQFLFAVRDSRGLDDIYLGSDTGASSPVLADESGSDTYPNVSPDRRSFIYVVGKDSDSPGRLWVADVGGDKMEPLFAHQPCPAVGPPAWSPDGTKLALICFDKNGDKERGIVIVGLDGTRLATLDADADASTPAWSQDGRIAYRRELSDGSHAGLVWLDYAAGDDKPTPVPHTGRWDNHPAWSLDGKYIAYQHRDDPHHPNGVYVVDPESGRPPVAVVTSSQVEVDPIWSPADIYQLIYSENGQLYVDDPFDDLERQPVATDVEQKLWRPGWGRR